MPKTIHLGFEVGTGKAVTIPLAHIAVTGQTQLSGKTTTLEAIVTRANVRALAFITKRGEGGFQNARIIPPFFQERSDWEYVEGILESTMRQRMKFERAWIVKACRGARSLADVQRHVAKLQKESKRSMDQDIFMLLGEYLERVVPLIASLPKASKLDLRPGLNVMDLHAYPKELQMLVIASSIRYIYQHEQGVVTIIPEAWKMLPQSKNTPVKVETENIVREGAGIKNFVWFDSQDMAAIDKMLLRAASTWIVGVQKESNEVERALKNMEAGLRKPKAADVMRLRLGQFFVAFDEILVKTYVQPLWLSEDEARSIALGKSAITDRPSPPERNPEPEPITPSPVHPIPESETDEMANSDEILAAVQETNTKIDKLVTTLGKQTPQTAAPTPARAAAKANIPPFDETKDGDLEDVREELYQRFKARLIQDIPAILEVIQELPEIRITVHRPVIELDNKSLTGKIALLLHDGFFDSGATASAVQKHLEKNGMEFKTNVPIYASLNELRELGAFTITEPGGKKGKVYTRAEGLKFTKKAG